MNRRLSHEGRMYNSQLQISKIGTQKHERNNGMSKTPPGVGVSRRDPSAQQKVRILRAHGDPRGNGLHQEKDAHSVLRNAAANRPLLDSDPATEGTAVGDRTCDGRL